MSDQSFCERTLERALRKSDFDHRLSEELKMAFRKDHVVRAIASANTSFNEPSSPLDTFSLKGKRIYRFKQLSDELVARKLCENLKLLRKKSNKGRSQIVQCLNLLLQEGVPFRVYRLDVKSFYESFETNFVRSAVQRLVRLSPHSKTLLLSLLSSHQAMGGDGIPRGLSLSALLSELLMRPFDIELLQSPNVYFYARYVDDIIAITSARESPAHFVPWVQKQLPAGLMLNTKKEKIVCAPKRVDPVKQNARPVEILTLEYLGYSFSVLEPTLNPKLKQPGNHHRHVTVDIAAKKIQKIKTRIIRSFIDYTNNHDWNLLKDRLKFLRQNFSVHNPKIGSKKLAGIYHSYPQLSEDAKGLEELDNFLRNAVLSRAGRLFSKTSMLLNSQQKNELLSQSFASGHRNKTFIHFSGRRIGEIQKCWLY